MKTIGLGTVAVAALAVAVWGLRDCPVLAGQVIAGACFAVAWVFVGLALHHEARPR